MGACLLSVLIVAACSSDVRAANIKPEKDRKPAPAFELKDSMGKAVKLSDYHGKVVLLNFWATWCAPCKIEIPWFVEFEQKHKDQGFAVLGVSMDDEGWEIVRPYLERAKINYRVLLGTDSVAQLYGGVDSLPTSFLIDRQGRVASVHVGLVGKNEYQADINQLLGVAQSGLARKTVPAVALRAD
jgi:cytochrome c biogenesis protein CcmG/thiol:disulfide interchange protein DsbE